MIDQLAVATIVPGHSVEGTSGVQIVINPHDGEEIRLIEGPEFLPGFAISRRLLCRTHYYWLSGKGNNNITFL